MNEQHALLACAKVLQLLLIQWTLSLQTSAYLKGAEMRTRQGKGYSHWLCCNFWNRLCLFETAWT